MKTRGAIRTPVCRGCIKPARGMAVRDTKLPYAAASRTAGLVVRLPTWAGETINLPTWGSIYPPTRSVRMGQGPPDELVKFLPAFLHEPWVPGSLEGEAAGLTPSLDEGPAWWHLYPPPWSVRGPFEAPTRTLHLSRHRGLHGPGDWVPQPDGSVTAPDGSPGWRDNADGTYTNSVVAGQGQVIVYTVDAAMAPLSALVVPPGQSPPAGVPAPAGAPPTAKPFTWRPLLLLGGAGAALFLLAAAVQKR